MSHSEKRCEYFDDESTYLGWNMRKYSRNRIQVNPNFWPVFKHARHVLVIQPYTQVVCWKGGGTSSISAMDLDYEHGSYYRTSNKSDVLNGKWRGPGIYQWSSRRGMSTQYLIKKLNVRTEYRYTLYCPDLLGEVDGQYLNFTYELSALKRRLKRLLKTDLNVIMAGEFEDIKSVAVKYFS